MPNRSTLCRLVPAQNNLNAMSAPTVVQKNGERIISANVQSGSLPSLLLDLLRLCDFFAVLVSTSPSLSATSERSTTIFESGNLKRGRGGETVVAYRDKQQQHRHHQHHHQHHHHIIIIMSVVIVDEEPAAVNGSARQCMPHKSTTVQVRMHACT